MNEKVTVIHHSADFDGIFCREIARKFMPDAELIGWDYGNPEIPFPEGHVYVLDLSPECFSDFETAPNGHNRLTWIDHHKSAIEKFRAQAEFGDGFLIDGVAACRLAWQWFAHPTNFAQPVTKPRLRDFKERLVDEPYAVRLAGEYDIWDKRDPNAELFQHGLRSQELTAWHWGQLLDPYPEKLLEGTGMGAASVSEGLSNALLQAGSYVQYARKHENESIIKNAGFTFKWEGLTWLGCNAARYNSQLFEAGLTPEHDACFGFAWRDGQWTVSLYHAPGKEHHDLSLIAVAHGGGGHRGACGFRTTTLPFFATTP